MNKPLNILLVDDDPNMQDLFKLVMDHYGIDLEIASDQTTALASLEENTPDVIVLDIFLPGTDGYTLLRKIRALQQPPQCSFVATTAYYTTDTPAQIQQAGFDGYLLKPLDTSQLVSYLSNIAHTT